MGLLSKHAGRHGSFGVALLMALLVGPFFGGCTALEERKVEAPPAVRDMTVSETMDEAQALYRRGETQAALHMLRDACARSPGEVSALEACRKAGEILFQEERYEETTALLAPLTTQRPYSPTLQSIDLLLGRAFLRLDAIDDAGAAFRRIAGADRPSPTLQACASYRLAEIHLHDGHRPGALYRLVEAIGADGQSGCAKKARLALETLIGTALSMDELLETLLLVKGDPRREAIVLRIARALLDKGRRDLAYRALEDVCGPDDARPICEEVTALRRLVASVSTVGPYTVGCILPLSGKFTRYGERALNAVILASGALRSEVGAPPVQLAVRDSRGEPEAARAAFVELATEVGAVAVIGPLLNRTAGAVEQEACRLGVPTIHLSSREENECTEGFVFHNGMTNTIQVEALVRRAVEGMVRSRFKILYPENSYGRNMSARFRETVQEAGGRIVDEISYPPRETDFTDEIRRLVGNAFWRLVTSVRRQSHRRGGLELDDIDDSIIDALKEKKEMLNFDVLFVPDTYKKISLIVPQLAFYDVTEIALLGTSGWNAGDLIEHAGEFLQGCAFTDGFFVESVSPLVRDFVDRYETVFGDKPHLIEAQSFDAMEMLLYAMTAIDGPADRERLREGLASVTNFAGASGTAAFGPGGSLEKTIFLLTIHGNRIVELN